MESREIANYIKIARQLEKQLGCRIYIVGGFVRDRILKIKSVDIDFAVEGDGIAAAEAFRGKLGGKLTVYKKFLTASIKLKNGFIIDFATARIEKYPSPASMPVVQPAKLEVDLLRRDFTINALALPLAGADSPSASVIDVCGGMNDIKHKLIRVLHKKSFIDDPTRILRAIRYAGRFNFNIEENTGVLMSGAIAKNLLSKVSAPRIRDEFIKTISEENAKKILLEFKKRKILKYIDGKLDVAAVSENKESVKTRLKKLLGNFTEEQKKSFFKKLCLPYSI